MHAHLLVFLDLLGLTLTLISYAILAEACLTNISIYYGLSQQSTGFILAIGGSIPEFTTNLLSSLQGKSENTALGLGAITGSGSYDFTLCFTIASFFTAESGLKFSKYFYYRDSFVYISTVFVLMIFLRDNRIYLYEALILMSFWPLYLLINWYFFSNISEEKCETSFYEVANESIDETCWIKGEVNEIQDKENIILKINNDETMHIHKNFEKHNHDIEFPSDKNYHKEIYNKKFNEICLTEDVIDEEANIASGQYIQFSDKNRELSQNSDYTDDKNNVTSPNILLKIIDTCANFFRTIYHYILPSIDKYPFLAFVIILFIAFNHAKFVVSLVGDVSHRTKIAASFFGVTLISWAGNVGDSINATFAAKAKKVDLLTTCILATQIMNLQISLSVPWTISMINNHNTNGGYFVDFGKENIIKLFFPLLIVVICSVLTMFLFDRTLNRYSGLCLMCIYLTYFTFESINSKIQA